MLARLGFFMAAQTSVVPAVEYFYIPRYIYPAGRPDVNAHNSSTLFFLSAPFSDLGSFHFLGNTHRKGNSPLPQEECSLRERRQHH
jgi:hypothetical protein